jgi:uncharacterized protein
LTARSNSAPMLQPGPWRPPVESTWLTEPFWLAAREHRLIVQRCPSCGKYIFRPQYACTNCLTTPLEWVDATGYGVINSYSVVRRPAYPELPDVYVVLALEMEEGWFMMSNLIGCQVEDVRVGMEIQTTFVDYGALTLPFAAPRL